MRAENITGPVAYHGEGPCWWDEWGGLRFLDVQAGDILTLTATGVDRLHTLEDSASFIRPRTNGGYVVGTRTGIALADGPNEAPKHHVVLLNDNNQQMNDGGTTPHGELLAGSMSSDGSPTGFLLQIAANLSPRSVVTSVGCSNGIAFTTEGDRAYYVDTITGRIDMFDYDDATLSNRRTFVTIDPSGGLPDGLTVDRDGNVWVALWGGAQVRAYDKDGKHIEKIDIPARQVSACTFGDDDLGTLYITTSRQGLDDADDPQAGSLFSVRTGTFGLPVVPFSG